MTLCVAATKNQTTPTSDCFFCFFHNQYLRFIIAFPKGFVNKLSPDFKFRIDELFLHGFIALIDFHELVLEDDLYSNGGWKRVFVKYSLYIGLNSKSKSCMMDLLYLLDEKHLEPALNLKVHCYGLELRVLNGYDQKSFLIGARGQHCYVLMPLLPWGLVDLKS
ncbi:hypothetical protein Tco_1524376 [Tanacetum coccineum]